MSPPLPLTVVLIDDSDALRQLMRRAIERSADFTLVAEAADGQAGVDAVRGSHPDLVLLDIALPVMDGLQALTLIREQCPSAIVVMLSSFGDASGLPAQTAALGAHGFVSKGMNPRRVLAELSAIVDTVAAS